MRTITYEEAFRLYLAGHYDEVMPFDNSLEYTFIQKLANQGLIVVDEQTLTEEYYENEA